MRRRPIAAASRDLARTQRMTLHIPGHDEGGLSRLLVAALGQGGAWQTWLSGSGHAVKQRRVAAAAAALRGASHCKAGP